MALFFTFLMSLLLSCMVDRVEDIYIVNKQNIMVVIQIFKNCFIFLYARYYL
jgi:hypothetical protein